MHELALMTSLVETVSERVAGARVISVKLEVGRFTCVVPDALSFCFEICAEGTALEGATLEIDQVPGRARCNDCGAEIAQTGWLALCDCGSANLELLAGQELRIREVEVI